MGRNLYISFCSGINYSKEKKNVNPINRNPYLSLQAYTLHPFIYPEISE